MSLWNGNRAALSLTFDDVLPCQLSYAVPKMNEYGIQGTFFAIAGGNQEYPLDVSGVRKIVPFGHEVGSHSVRHLKAATLNASSARYETAESKRILENHFAVPVESFCYPYTDAPGFLQDAVRDAGYKQARGGRVARRDKYIVPGDGLNFLDVPCFHINDGSFEHGAVEAQVYAALERGAWLTLMFHGVGPKASDWDNVFPSTWEPFMAFLRMRKEEGLWVAPFGTVAENLRSNQ